MRASARFSLVLGLLAAAVSCRRIVGIDDRAFHDGGPPVCGLPTLGATPACAPCMTQACCAPSSNCANADGCPKLSGCVQACASGDAACRAKCTEGMTPDSTARQALELVEACRDAACATDCTAGPWACLGQVEWSSPPFVYLQLKITATLLDPSLHRPIKGAEGRACSIADPMCASPLATGTSTETGILILNV